MYTPQRLFGEVGSSSEILSHEPFLERARLQREQEQDGSARLAMGAYLVARLVDKLLTLPSNSDGTEGFSWQLEAVRRHVAELPGDSSETAHLGGIVSAISAAGSFTPSLWKSLTAYAYYLEHEGRLAEALEMLTLAARSQGQGITSSDFITYALFAGRLNRLLARWDQATVCYCAAQDAASQSGDMVAKLRGRLGCGAVDRGRGNLPLARTTAESVVREAAELGLQDVQAMAYADLGAVYGLQGLQLEALEAQYRAFKLTSDMQQQIRMLGDVAFGLREIGALEAARLAFSIVAQSSASSPVRANANLELMELESCLGNRVAFERYRLQAEEYRPRMSPSMLCDYSYKLGNGLARFGQVGRAKVSFEAGMLVAESHRLNVWYFKLQRALEGLNSRPEHPPVDECTSDPNERQRLRQMELELKEYAEASVC